MKHYSEFLEPMTHELKRIAKLANTLVYEVQEKEMNLKNAKENLSRMELLIENKISSNYNNQLDFENAICKAKHKAKKYNTEPITNHLTIKKPH